MRKLKNSTEICRISLNGNPLNRCGKPAKYVQGKGIFVTYICEDCIEGVRARNKSNYTIF